MKTKKYKEVLSLYEKTSTEVSKSPKDWLTFLDSACNNYKLRFDEQLLIYAQRPDATAVLELNRWNRNFGRWVKSGTKGIAVFGDAPKGNGTLKYYFDISDTRETDHSRKVTIWEIQPEYNNNIIKSLENSFGYLSEKSNIFDAVISAVKNISENILANNTQRQLIYATENSLLEELSDDIVIAQYTELVRNSAAYMTAKRLRLDTNERFFQDDFVNIINFNTKKTLEILGIAVNQVSKSLLSIIAKTMNNLYSIERSFYNDRREQTITENNLRREVRPLVHIGRENADISSESYSAGTAGSTDRTVRKNESEVPERKSRGNILYSPDELQAKRAFDGNRADSDRDGGTPDERNGSFRGSNGEAESGGYDELGTQNEQHQKPSSGNRDERSNLRLEYYDRIGRTQATMDTLVSQAESEKTQDITLPEFYRDFLQIKTDNPNSLVLYQFGDFFEAYGEDAQKIADALELMLTSRSVSDSQKIPMVGFPQRRLEIYMNMLTDRGYDLTVSAINGDDRKVFSIVSTNKEDPVESEPIGRIDYLHTDGSVRESVEYTSPYQFEKDIKEENSYDVPMKVFLYKGRDGNTIPSDFLSSVGVQGVEIINSPYLETASDKVEKTSEPVAPVLQQPKKSRVHSFDLHPEIPMSDRSNFNLKENPIEEVGKKERFRRNMEAIRVLKQCREEKRYATSDEQLILSKYVGWGGLADCFDERHSHYAELKNRLSPDEYAAARESTLTAFYTPPTVIKAVYKALEQLGFREGNILEPSCGIGHFIGMLPDSMKESRIYGVELDSISAGIAQQLYQKTSIAAQPFEEANLPDSFFDAVVGNVPFGDFKVSDKRYDKHKFLIHDYFFAKSLDKLRPGGVMALITSKGTMDKENPAVRKYIAQRADLLGAVRLPNNTFKGNAGTEVVSDILILQKRDRIVDIEPDWVHLAKDENGITMNSYFVEHPEMILGEMKMVSGRFGPESSCIPYEGAELEELLDDAIANIHGDITSYEVEEELTEEDNSIPADPTVRNFSYTLVDGRVYFRENSRMAPVDVSATAENRIKGMITIRDCVRNLIELQTEDYPDAEIKAEQGRLNKLYDIFTEKYGLINSRANTSAFSQDSSFSLLSALEVLDDEGNLERKADMFFKRTIKPHTPVTSVDTASEALAVSMGEKACIDMDYMCQLSGKTEEEIFADLKGVIFLNPMYGYGNSTEAKYLMADEYLSGNVREKLAVAKKSALLSPEDYTINVEALQKVQPKDLTASEISVRLGATWLPPEIVKQFMFEFLGTPGYARYNIKLHFFEFTGEWSIEGKTNDKGNVKAYSTYGTSRINAYKIIEETLNLKDVRIFDYVEDEEGKKKAILNKKETAIAQSKQELIKQGFQDWIWSKPERRETLCKLYNEKFNSIRPREYDGSHITFNGMNPEVELREHQKNAVAHILYGGNTLLAHAVGAGKTYEMTAAAMESKRLGLCSKSLFVVPNHLTEQWAAEFLQLYPAANILVATKKDFETKNRKRFCGRIATGDYDAIIIGHSQFEKIPMSIERQRAILEQQLDEVTAGIADLKKSRGDNFSIKQLERTKKSVKQKLDKLNDQSRKDDVVTFEELGVDRIFIDESHYYKNLFLYTKMRNVGGIAQTEAQKSSDLFMKCRYLDEITGGRGTVFATGTPISNSMVELYTIQRYLQYNTLVKNNLQHFDAWASTFGETVSAVELTPEGTGYRSKTRFARFFNLPELMAMFKEVADIKTADTLNLPVPKANFHNISVKPSDIQKEIVASLAERADKVRNDMVDASVDNMLKITNDGRKLALDQRLINPMLPDFENSKINACVDNIYQIWEETGDKKSAQLVFCDLSTPKNDGKFSVYDDIRKKLIERGIPAEEIKFIHEADTEAKKLELFKKVRRGDVRVLMGSTQKMGAGTNVQNKLIALHDIDCPWRPSDLEQRSGRIIRQGNENAEVNIYRYVTEQTFDAYLYQLVEGKQKFASQIMTSKSPVRSCEDIDETALSYAEIKMLATGNPYIKEKMDLDIQVQKLRLLKSNFLSEKYALEDKIIKFYPQEIARLKQRITALENDIITVNNNVVQEKDAFSPMTLEGIDYTKKAVAGQMLLTACKEHAFEEPTEIGSYRGFRMEVSYSILTSEYRLDLCGNLRHQVTLGTDIFGNITRIDNELAKIPAKLEAAKHVLTETLEQYDYAKEQIKKPFASEDDLQKKTNRLNELNAFLNIEKAAPKNNSSSDGIEYKFRKCSEAEKNILVDNGFSDYRYSDSDNKYIFRYPAEQEMKINAALNIRQNNIKI